MEVKLRHRCGRLPFCVLTVLLVLFIVLSGSSLSFSQEGSGDVVLAIIGTLDLYPLLPEEGDIVNIGALVANNGVKDARDVSIYFYEDSVYFDKTTIDIRAGDTAYVETTWTADSGDSLISIAVDPAAEYHGDKDNISTSTWITVR